MTIPFASFLSAGRILSLRYVIKGASSLHSVCNRANSATVYSGRKVGTVGSKGVARGSIAKGIGSSDVVGVPGRNLSVIRIFCGGTGEGEDGGEVAGDKICESVRMK